MTAGTSHGGGDLNLLGLFYSEAVRDLRTQYYTGTNGVYLFGGLENASTMSPNLLTNYQNIDVNCNGIIGERILGLNKIPLPNDVTFISIVGNSTFLIDIVVTEFSQNLTNFQKSSSLYNTFNIKGPMYLVRKFTLSM
ncbi:hypothetical protein [Emticicia sp. BO119]|uniref:hypothetical protein n=1 Tax=Emticicia sp. BO119 TaxID=2757768 RepID=UPI0015F0B48D|nr:hypothetical protein [Emticicia sp. BO119]MBA4849042.1 hypothetical protein [Emticicia sp. BO119]